MAIQHGAPLSGLLRRLTRVHAQGAGNQEKTLSCNKQPAQSSMCFYGSCFQNKVLGDASFKTEQSWTVALADPNHAIATDTKGKKHKGTWTTVYDEGFEVRVAGRKVARAPVLAHTDLHDC